MDAVLLLAGLLAVAAALLDAVATTLTAGTGGGPLTIRVSSAVWRVQRYGLPRSARARVLPYAGAIVLLATLLSWVLLLWAGFSLLLTVADRAVVDAQTALPASVAERVYYAGFVLFTLGVGDYVAGTPLWQVVTAVAAFLGLFLVTLSITYLVSVVSAAVGRRRLALAVAIRGRTGPELVELLWDGQRVSREFGSFSQQMSGDLVQLAQQHLAYPVLHYFHTSEDVASAPRSIAALDDAYVLLSAGLAQQARPPDDVLLPLRRALEHYAETVQGSGSGRADPPPLPPLESLRAAGMPVVERGRFEAAGREHADRRAGLHELVRRDARSWPGEGESERGH